MELDLIEDELSAFLGEDPNTENKNTFELHKALCSRWGHIITHGLGKDQKLKLLECYNLPNNCNEMIAPIVNPEITGVLSSPHLKRDEAHLGIQKQLNIGIAALGKAMDILLEDKGDTPKELKEQLLATLSDSGRIFSDLSFTISAMRRTLIMPSLNKTIKDLVEKTVPLKFLFGADLGEKVKEAKLIERAKKDLKPDHITATFTQSSYKRPNDKNRQAFKRTQTSLNRRGPIRRGEAKSQRGNYPKKDHYQRKRH